MSRIGKKPVEIPSGVQVSVDGNRISAKGPKGELAMAMVDEVDLKQEDNAIAILPKDQSKRSRSMWGMQRTLVSNLFEGVSAGFEKKLEITGVGYRAQVKGKVLNLQLGFSHEVDYPIPDDVSIATPDQATVIVSGIDKQKVGQVAAEIREYRKPEPYKGKGGRYAGEYIFRKEGKKK